MRNAIAGFRKTLTTIVTRRLRKRAEINRDAPSLNENFSLIRTNRNNAINVPNVKEAIFNPTSTNPSDIFPEK